MTSYIRRAYPAKKMGILEKREYQLMNKIRFGHDDESLRKAAEKVREAHLAVLKGKRHYVVDDGTPDFPGFKKIDSEAAEWRLKTAEEIVEKYKKLSLSEIHPT